MGLAWNALTEGKIRDAEKYLNHARHWMGKAEDAGEWGVCEEVFDSAYRVSANLQKMIEAYFDAEEHMWLIREETGKDIFPEHYEF
jgi:hypothetical protein